MNVEISVLMSAYNAELTIARAIESILNQSFSKFELILINDGSTDRTGEIAQQYASRDARIRLIHQENTGLTRALNRGLAISTAQYIARQDADDESLPRRLEVQLSAFENAPDLILVGTDVVVLDDDHNEISTVRNSQRQNLRRALYRTNQFFHGSIMFRRFVAGQPVTYCEYYKKAQDYDLCLRLAELGEVAILQDVLYRFYVTRSGISATNVHFYGDKARENAIRRLRGDREDFSPPSLESVRPRPSELGYRLQVVRYMLAGCNTAGARRILSEIMASPDATRAIRRSARSLYSKALLPGRLCRELRRLL